MACQTALGAQIECLIKNGRIVTSVDDYHADIFINGSTIALIGKDSGDRGRTRKSDASGKLVIPGGVDPHTHLELPFGGTTTSDTFETGTRGGSLWRHHLHHRLRRSDARNFDAEGLDDWHAKAQSKNRDRLCISHDRHRPCRRNASARLRSLADNGITSYKLFMAYPGALLSDDGPSFVPCARRRRRHCWSCQWHAETRAS